MENLARLFLPQFPCLSFNKMSFDAELLCRFNIEKELHSHRMAVPCTGLHIPLYDVVPNQMSA